MSKEESSLVVDKLRPEFATAYNASCMLVEYVDPVYTRVEQATGMLLPVIWNKYAGLIAAMAFFPVMTIALPFCLFAFTLGLPIFLPIALVTGALVAFNSVIIAALLAISPPGRKRIVQPMVETVLAEEAGRQLVYAEGPRPGPVALCNAFAPKSPIWQLYLCLFMDFIMGNATYLIPLLGEGFDLIWGPMQALMMGAMFDKTMPAAKWLGLAEEVMPMTDIIPSATLSWIRCNSSYVQEKLQPSKRVQELDEKKGKSL